MVTEIKVPSPGESINRVQLSRWLVNDGDWVEKDQDIAEIDSEKATLNIASPVSGQITIRVQEGETVPVGEVICSVNETAVGVKKNKQPLPKNENPPAEEKTDTTLQKATKAALHATPLARKMMEAENISEHDFLQSKRVSARDVKAYLDDSKQLSPKKENVVADRSVERKKLSPLRLKLSERLVAVKNETAMLTTFNEVDMSAIQSMRSKYGVAFQEKYGITLGIMGFFTMAATRSLMAFPQVNSMIEGDELISFNYTDIGMAVSAPKGLVVPVIRDTHLLTLAGMEAKIKELAGKAKENKITLEEMQGGTFTITNGGVFGSMLSTPILNPPQSAILGMHNIINRPVAIDGKVEIRPMMYLALSYDHRIIDGRESVGFLVSVKKFLEEPWLMLLDTADPEKQLLGL
ncbi:MAG: 2-oxoglutarate dehydrogenase complex dihydrolipoyllysine-residue succinyltransferase [Bacteroidetes bacterium]|nr:2-oxoglutarate dehydrogenase complex dihydrolipoyllysine-residue succinyltransferase [Bacteroidota bacterium]